MRGLNTFVLIAILSSSGQATSSLPRGVGPEYAKHYTYTSQGTFKCIANAKVIDSAYINDEICDCPDGSDEPGTAACAHLNNLSPPQPLNESPSHSTNTTNSLPGFWCANQGHVGMYVPFMYVNDGICDYDSCCDGSDEYAGVGGVKCENRCAEIGAAYRRAEKEKARLFERASKKRSAMVAEAAELRRQLEGRIAKHKADLVTLEKKEAELKQKYDKTKASEAGKASKSSLSGELVTLLDSAKTRVNNMRTQLDAVSQSRKSLQKKVIELEAIMTKLKDEYNPNFNDEGVKGALHSWDNYLADSSNEILPGIDEFSLLDALQEDSDTTGINWKAFEKLGSSSDVLSGVVSYLPSFVGTRLLELRVWLIENGVLADNPTASGESALETAAREAYDAAVQDTTNKRQEIEREEADLSKDYGPDEVFRHLKDKCITMDTGEYTYELCWLSRTTQKSKKGHGDTNMGYFTRFETLEAHEGEPEDGKGIGTGPRLVLKYENGMQCWNGPQRSTDVWLACAEKEEVWRVAEAEKCVYRMEVGTPAVCGDAISRSNNGANQKHDEL